MSRRRRSFFGNLALPSLLLVTALAACATTAPPIDEPVPLTLEGTPALAAVEGQAYAGFTVQAAGGEEPYLYSLVGDWPAGIAIDPATGEVTGTASEYGAFANLTVQVEDEAGYTAALAPFGLEILPSLSFETLAAWWATTPEASLSEYGTLRFELAFVNESGGALDFDGDEGGNTPDEELQLWSVPSVDLPAITVESWPEGAYADGATLNWTFLVDVSTLDPGDTCIALRPVSNTLGVMGPGAVSLASQSITAPDW